MEQYSHVASRISRLLTRQYSTSFASASRLFAPEIRPHIYNIYGLVRIADEIVDTYKGADAPRLLDDLEQETYAAMERGFSVNPVVQAFATTARQSNIKPGLIEPFFTSMRMDTDLPPPRYDQAAYERYIYGSAEVVGLMCLQVFCKGNVELYERLAPGAQLLGAAYQKVNFLRDLAADWQELGRCYFPGTSFEGFDERTKQAVVADIRADFTAAHPYVRALPPEARRAVMTSYTYYAELLERLDRTSAEEIKQRRVRVPGCKKALLLAPQLFHTVHAMRTGR